MFWYGHRDGKGFLPCTPWLAGTRMLDGALTRLGSLPTGATFQRRRLHEGSE